MQDACSRLRVRKLVVHWSLIQSLHVTAKNKRDYLDDWRERLRLADQIPTPTTDYGKGPEPTCWLSAAAAFSLSLILPVTAKTETLSVMTFNVYFLTSTLFKWGQDIRANMIAESEFIKGHDILVVEECFDNDACNILRKGLLKEYPYQTPTVGQKFGGSMPWSSTAGSNTRFVNGGVVVFSKWPIEEQHQYIFKYYCGFDRLANKGFAQVILNYRGAKLHIYGTHMQSDDSTCLRGEAAQVRKRNLDYWRSYIDNNDVPPNELILFAGDFNIERNTKEFDSLLTDFEVDQPDSYQGHPHTLDTSDNSIARYNQGPSEYLDYVFLDKKHRVGVKSFVQNVLRVKSRDFQLDKGVFNDYSDHYPVHVLIQIDMDAQ
ncbi:hypothetical protein FBU30_001489 [Linnemannia zychae]|nr:hypothetical protein FBU30_001489 [Linnemannia zychae]